MKFLWLDQGFFPHLASSLSNNGKHEVVYFSSWETAFSVYESYSPGVNWENIRKEKDFFKWVEWADCILNFDIPDNDTIAYLRRKYPNKSIFGAGNGNRLELDRWLLKKLIQSFGLPLQKSYHIKGINNLEKFIKEKPDKYIKTNIFRTDCETFYAKNYKFVENKLKLLEVKFEPNEDEVEFVAEEPIDTKVEIGFDGFFNGNDFLEDCFYGYEVDKALYVGRRSKTRDLPKPLKDSLAKFKPKLQEMDYRGCLSTEEKIKSEKEHYFLDICSRLATPLGYGYAEWIKNLPEVIYKVGKKEMVKLDCPYKYVFAMPLETEESDEYPVYMDVKKENLDKVKLMMSCKDKDGNYYAIKGMSKVCTLVAGADTIEEGLKKIKAYGELVDCDGLNKKPLKGIDEIHEIIKAGSRVGINFS